MMPLPFGLQLPIIPRTYSFCPLDDLPAGHEPFNVSAWARGEVDNELTLIYLVGSYGLGKTCGLQQIHDQFMQHGQHGMHSCLIQLPEGDVRQVEQFLNDVFVSWAAQLAGNFHGLRQSVNHTNTWRANIDAFHTHTRGDAPSSFCLLIEGLEKCEQSVQNLIQSDFLYKYLASQSSMARFTAILAQRVAPRYQIAPLKWVQAAITLDPMRDEDLARLIADRRNALISVNAAYADAPLEQPMRDQVYSEAIEVIFALSPLPPWLIANQLARLLPPEIEAIGEDLINLLPGHPLLDLHLLARAFSLHPNELTRADFEVCAREYLERIWTDAGNCWPDLVALICRPGPHHEDAIKSAGIGPDAHALLGSGILTARSSDYEFDPALRKIISLIA